MAHPTQSLFVSPGQSTEYQVHPMVVLGILDHYKRRNDDQERVVGTLLGELVPGGVVIKNYFPIPHTEKDEQVTLDMDYHAGMLELHQQINPKEVVVGWYSTGDCDEITYVSTLIHDVYRKECSTDAVHLIVDTALTNSKLGIKAYVSTDVSVGGRKVMCRFEHVNVQLTAYEAEKIGVDALINSIPDDDEKLDAPATVQTELENLEISLSNLLQNIGSVKQYVQAVVDGQIKGDEAIGRSIAEAMAALPRLDKNSFNAIFDRNIQDLLMIVYLSNITRTQLVLSDKIQYVIAQS